MSEVEAKLGLRGGRGGILDQGLFINDVINFGGYRDPPLPLVITRHFLATRPLIYALLATKLILRQNSVC